MDTNVYLLIFEAKFFRQFAEEILAVLEKSDDLTVEQHLYWLDKAKTMIDIAKTKSENTIEIVEKFQILINSENIYLH